MKKTSLIIFSVVLASVAQAQEIQLKTAVDEALQFSPVVQRSRANMQDAEWKKYESYTGFLPTLTGDVNYLLAKKYVQFTTDSGVNINQILPTTQFLLTGSLPVFDGFTSLNRFRAGSHLYEAAQNDSDWTEFSVSKETTLLFYRALVAKNLMDVANQNAHTIEDHYKDVNALLKAGIATKFDVLRVGVQMNEAEAEVLRTQDEYDFAKIRLTRTMGKDSDNRTPVGSFPALTPSLIDGYNAKLNQRKDIVALSEQSASLTNVQKANNRFWVPKLSLYGQIQAYNNVNDEFSDWDAYREAYQMGVNLKWNIFDGMSSISKSKQAKAQATAAQNGVRSASLKANEDTEIWKRKFVYFCKLVDVKKNQTQKAEEAVRLAKESVRAGTKTNSDLLDAELDLFKSRADILNVQMGMIEALINFELATGQKIYDFSS